MENNNKNLPDISVVVIGLNEEGNLHNTFSTINNMDYPRDKIELIYVDSGSKDNSVEIAKKYTDKVFVEKIPFPTAANGRNKGLIEAQNEIIHFIDGDVRIDPNYLKIAVKNLSNPDIHVVFGKLEEKYDYGINKILLSSWQNLKEGYCTYTGAGGTYKKFALQKVNGYDERISRGEETELGERFINAGFKIWFMNIPMGVHDYGVKNLKDIFKIFYVDGECKATLMLQEGESHFFQVNKKMSLSNIVQNCIILSVAILIIILGKYELIILMLVLYISALFLKYNLMRGIKDRDSLKYFYLMNFLKPIVFLGQLNIFFLYIVDKTFRKSIKRSKQKLFFAQ